MENRDLQAIKYSYISLPEKPLLMPWVTWINLGDDQLQFRGSKFTFSLLHPLFIGAFFKIQPLLNGTHSVGEIASSGGEAFLPTTIDFLLRMLRANGILQEAHPFLLSPETNPKKRSTLFLSHILQDAGHSLEILSNIRLGLMGQGSLADDINLSLSSMGIENIYPSNPESMAKDLKNEGIELFLACQESPGFSFFEEVNKKCLETGVRWMHIAQQGSKTVLGPTIVPFQSACFECYSTRIDALIPDLNSQLAFKEIHNQTPLGEGYFPPMGQVVAGQVAMEVARIFLGYSPPITFGRFYEFDAAHMAPNSHSVLRFPRCPACYQKKPPMEIWDTKYPPAVADQK